MCICLKRSRLTLQVLRRRGLREAYKSIPTGFTSLKHPSITRSGQGRLYSGVLHSSLDLSSISALPAVCFQAAMVPAVATADRVTQWQTQSQIPDFIHPCISSSCIDLAGAAHLAWVFHYLPWGREAFQLGRLAPAVQHQLSGKPHTSPRPCHIASEAFLLWSLTWVFARPVQPAIHLYPLGEGGDAGVGGWRLGCSYWSLGHSLVPCRLVLSQPVYGQVCCPHQRFHLSQTVMLYITTRTN